MINFSSLINSFRRKRLDKQIEYLENNLNYLGARIDEAYAYGSRTTIHSVREMEKCAAIALAELKRLRNKRKEVQHG